MLKGFVTVGAWTMGSRLAGFVRDMLIASLAGTGPVADAFFIALRVPNLFRRLFGEGAFNAAFVPEFSGILARDGTAQARQFAQEAIAVMAFWLLLLVVAGEVFMPQLMALLTPGFADVPGKQALTIELARITFPYVFLICLAALLSGVLNGLDRFAAAAAAPLVFNAVSIAAMLGLTPFLPSVGHALAWGVTVSGVLQLALLAWAVRRAGMALHVPRPRLTPRMRVLLRRMGPGLIGAGVTQLNLSVDIWIVSYLPPGSAAVLNYADRVNQLPLGVIGTAVGTALLPLLSRQVRTGEDAQAIGTLNRATELTLALTLPAAVALAIAGYPIMLVLFGRGAFDATAATLSAQSLAAYAFGLPAFVLLKVFVPAFFARGDTSAPVRIGLVAIGLNLVLNLLFMTPLQHMGPALATSVSALFNVLALAILLARRGHFTLDPRLRRRLPRIAVAAAAMGAALALLLPPLAPWFALEYVRWAALAGLVTAGAATYAATGQLIGAFSLRDLLALLRRRGA